MGSAAGADIRGGAGVTMLNRKGHRARKIAAGNRKGLALVFGSRARRQAGDTAQFIFGCR